jgi:hypothetical protein
MKREALASLWILFLCSFNKLNGNSSHSGAKNIHIFLLKHFVKTTYLRTH